MDGRETVYDESIITGEIHHMKPGKANQASTHSNHKVGQIFTILRRISFKAFKKVQGS